MVEEKEKAFPVEYVVLTIELHVIRKATEAAAAPLPTQQPVEEKNICDSGKTLNSF